MGYESLSTLVVLVIIVIVMMVWLPRTTARGMKEVVKHRSDRYSASLHVLDEECGSRFSDEKPRQAKGAIMPTTRTDREKNRAYVTQVRALRRAAARRRSILATVLLAATVLVVVLAVVLHFSAWYALIPAALLAAVCALGANASRQARDWERRMADKQRDLRKKERQERRQAQERQEVRRERQAREASQQDAATGINDAHTDVMEQREIRRALKQAREEQLQAKARREEHARQLAEAMERAATAPLEGEGNAAGADSHSQLVVRGDMEHYLPDQTDELSAVHHTASAVDAFDMAMSQDLISFSLGEERNGAEPEAPAVESLEIKSTRQVAKAVPAERDDADESVEVAQAAAEAVSPANLPGVNDSVAFHESEQAATVDAPDETSDSLGAGLASILARRGN